MSGPNILIINPVNDIEVLKGLASECGCESWSCFANRA